MAVNFEKKLATYIEDIAGGNFKLSDTQVNDIVRYLAATQNYVAAYGEMLAVEVGTDGSKTITKDVKQTVLTKKTTFGGADNKAQIEKPKLSKVQIAWSDASNKANPIGVTNYDNATGFSKVAAQKLAGIVYDAFKAYQRKFFSELIASVEAAINAGNVTGIKVLKLPFPINNEAKARFVWSEIGLATDALFKTIDNKQHIDHIEPDWTIFDVDRHLNSSMAQLGFAGEKTQLALTGGKWVGTEISDAPNVRVNPYLSENTLDYVDTFPIAGIQTVKFKAKFPFQILKSRVAEFDESGDQVTYYEDRYGMDVARAKQDSPTIVFDGLINIYIFDKSLDVTDPDASNFGK